MTRPLLLDAFCCEGVGALGYLRAGFAVVGVDTKARFRTRYPGVFVAGDALAFIRRNVAAFSVVHASPPCQRFTHGNAAGAQAEAHPDLVTPTRELLAASGRPYVIENVPRAPLIDPLVLCGTMFGLSTLDTDGVRLHLRRHRLFESNVPLTAPGPCRHAGVTQWAGTYGGARHDKAEARHVRRGGYVPPDPAVRARLLGVEPGQFTGYGMSQAIPPAYTEHLGRQLMEAAA
jgi:DNA (cytosine-5)-methyltransferase 1